MNASLRCNPTMITKLLDGEAVIMDPQQGKILALNEVGSFIWDKLQEQLNKQEILKALCSEFTVSEEVAGKDLDEFLVLLQQKDLLIQK